MVLHLVVYVDQWSLLAWTTASI